MNNQNNNNSIYENYQNNSQNQSYQQQPNNQNFQNGQGNYQQPQINQVPNYQQPMIQQSVNNQSIGNQSYIVPAAEPPKGRRILKTVMILSLILIIVSIGGFALVYTGVIKIGYVKPASILLNTSNIGVKKGKGFQYDYQVYPESSTAKNVYYESSDPSIADVNSLTGYVTPVKEGTVNITVKSQEDDQVIESSTLTVTTKKIPVTDIKLSSEKIVFDLSNKNKSQLLKVTLEPYNATDQSLQYYSSNENVAIVDSNGRIFPIGFGMATITVASKYGNASSKCEVIVTDSENQRVYFETNNGKKLVFPYSIQLEMEYLKLKYGTSRKVGFTLLPPDVTEDVVTWISSDINVASVKDGVVYANAIGQATITARTVNDLVATLIVDVTDEDILPDSLSFSNKDQTMEVGDQKTLKLNYDITATNTSFEWTSSDTSVISVNQVGLITALKAGNSTITVKAPNGVSASIDISVSEGKELPSVLTPVESNMTIETGTSKAIEILGDTEASYIYKSSNEDVATVSERGIVYGVGVGNALIYISTSKGLTLEVKVEVKNVEPTKISIAADADSLKVGESKELTVEVLPANVTNKKITWSTSNSKVLIVEDGVIRGVGVGEATITATIGNLNSSLKFNVVNKTVEVSNEEVVIQENLNASEKEKLKTLPIIYSNNGVNVLNVSIDFVKYGFNIYVDYDKTTYELGNVSSTIKNIKIDKGVITYDEGSKGTFEVIANIKLTNGESIKTSPTVITLTEGVATDSGSKEESQIPKTIEQSISLQLNVDDVKEFIFNDNTYTDKVTNWTSNNPSVATVEKGMVIANAKGKATITGSYENYNYTLSILVVEETSKIVEQEKNVTWEYGKCQQVCSEGGTLVSTNLPKSSSCGISAPYLVQNEKTNYTMTCDLGNGQRMTYKGVSTAKPVEITPTLNYANGTSVTKNQKLTIKVKNYTQITGTMTYKTSDGKKGNVTNGSFDVTVPSNTATSFNVTVTTQSGKTTTVAFTIKEEKKCKISKVSTTKLDNYSGYTQVVLSDCSSYEVKDFTIKASNTSCINVTKTEKNSSGLKINFERIKSNKKACNSNINVTSNYGNISDTVSFNEIDTTPKYTDIQLVSPSARETKVGSDWNLTSTKIKLYDSNNDTWKNINKAEDFLKYIETEIEGNIIVRAGSKDDIFNPDSKSIYEKGNYVPIEVGNAKIIYKIKGTNITTSQNVIVKQDDSQNYYNYVSMNCPSIEKNRFDEDFQKTKLIENCQLYDKANNITRSLKDIPSYKYKIVSYVANDNTILSDENYRFNPKKTGKAKIKVDIVFSDKRKTALSSTFEIQITNENVPYSRIEFSYGIAYNSFGMNTGEQLKFPFSLHAKVYTVVNHTLMTITSSNPDVVEVSDSSIIAKSAGKATITAKYKDLTSSIDFIVTDLNADTCYRYRIVTQSYDNCPSGTIAIDNTAKCYGVIKSESPQECEYVKGGKMINNVCVSYLYIDNRKIKKNTQTYSPWKYTLGYAEIAKLKREQYVDYNGCKIKKNQTCNAKTATKCL